MSFQEAIETCFRKYADFTGRARRSEYWWWILFNVIISSVLRFVSGGRISGPLLLSSLLLLALLVPSLAVAVRRLHDTGRSGWFLLIALIPIVGGIILIVFMATEGNPGDNQYGAPPQVPHVTS